MSTIGPKSFIHLDPVIESKKLITDHNAKDFRNWKESDPDRFIEFIRLVIKKDLYGVVRKSDYIICLWDKSILKGGGTHGEVTLAYYNRKPITNNKFKWLDNVLCHRYS